MADDDPARIHALLREDAELCQADRRLDAVGGDRHAGLLRGPRGRAMHALLLRADPRPIGPDLADDPGPDAALADPVLELAGHFGRRRAGCRPAAPRS